VDVEGVADQVQLLRGLVKVLLSLKEEDGSKVNLIAPRTFANSRTKDKAKIVTRGPT
jgi:hypothetical protein